jgi:hypothetical protein
VSERDIQEVLTAAEEYLDATTGPFNAPRIQHSRKRLRALVTQAKETPKLSERLLSKPWVAAQADGDPGA